MKARYLIASIIIHALFFLHLSMSGDGGSAGHPDKTAQEKQKQASASHPDNPTVIPKATEVEIREVPPEHAELVTKKVEKKSEPKAIHNCVGNNWYGGIGIQDDFFGGGIDQVYPGYPADKAGLKKGDVIILVDGKEQTTDLVRGPPGTTVTVTVRRGAEMLEFVIVRDKICTVEGPTVPEP